MIYVVYGKEEYLVDQKVKKKKKNPITYDLEFDNLKDILFDASMISLLDDKKYIVVNNPYFLSMAKEGEPNIDTSVLEDYLNNINPNTVMVFKYYREKLMETKKITKLLKNKGIFYEFNKVNNLDIIKDRFDGYKIDKESINILIDRVGDNTAVLINEIEKLKTYKYDTKEYRAAKFKNEWIIGKQNENVILANETVEKKDDFTVENTSFQSLL